MIDETLTFCDMSSIAELINKKLQYNTPSINVVVNLASQVHQVPQVGFPQIEPVSKVKAVKNKPISAEDRDKAMVLRFFLNRAKMLLLFDPKTSPHLGLARSP